MKKFDLIEMKVPATVEYIGVVRLSLSGIANRMGFSYEDIEDLKVAVSEAMTSVITHMGRHEEEGQMTIRFKVYEKQLEVMIAVSEANFGLDDGNEQAKVKEETGAMENVGEGGIGLFLMDALMDDVQINNDNGIVVFMRKFLYEIEVGLDEDQISNSK